jgi:phosphoribosylglycinamide formyltransferase-1
MAMLPARPSLAFLASHNGTSMRAIVTACRGGQLRAFPVVLISNNAGSAAMAWAKDNRLPAVHISAKAKGSEAAADAAIAATLAQYGADLVVLAGYMRMLGPETLGAFENRILNVHPALLPKFGGHGMYGRHVHEAVLAAGEKETGATVHLVDNEYDRGPVVAQAKVPVQQGDTPDTLALRVQAKEQELYPETLRRIIAREIDLDQL